MTGSLKDVLVHHGACQDLVASKSNFVVFGNVLEAPDGAMYSDRELSEAELLWELSEQEDLPRWAAMDNFSIVAQELVSMAARLTLEHGQRSPS